MGRQAGGNGYGASPPPKSAQKLGLAPRGKAELASFVRQDIPEIGFRRAAAIAVPERGAGTGTGETRRGCLGCAVTERDGMVSGGWVAALGAVALAVRRRRRNR